MEELADTRQQWKVKHTLSDIIFIVLVATIANADEWTEIEMFAQKNEQFFKQYIALENGIPTHDTIRRVMAHRNTNEHCKNDKKRVQSRLCSCGKRESKNALR
ncbi:transposase family protein [Treponema phagedenis]